jgi:hypothetical protein
MSKRYASFAIVTAALVSLAMLLAGCGKPEIQEQQSQEDPDSKSLLRASYDPIHFRPAIASASNEQCLACHREVIEDRVRPVSPAGLKAADTRAWYQRVSTYQGEQDTFHRRHLETPMAKELMNLQCNTCHEGHDPREEAPGSSATGTSQGSIPRLGTHALTRYLGGHEAILQERLPGMPRLHAHASSSGQLPQGRCH